VTMRHTPLLAIFLLSLTIIAASAGEPIFCDCKFAQSSGYRAVGIRTMCSAMTTKNPKVSGEYCEIAFGAIGYDERVISKLSNDKEYRAHAFAVTMQNLQALQDRSIERIANRQFVETAIPFYLRAVYARAGNGLEPETLVALDKEVRDVSREFADQIVNVFAGKQDPFERSWRERHRLIVQRGAIRFIYNNQIVLDAVFFSPEGM
jgi:hypothetical protein